MRNDLMSEYAEFVSTCAKRGDTDVVSYREWQALITGMIKTLKR